ncbi:MAG: prepilin-type N-terminal cleavage/methylation domain-containing protein [Synergistaceae bacterium]|jgi:prepilin-type N-terminal cleavage/methylation domain-containing protein|nr:prepilin-type N-terminal cleavage/methylation domain-containing protein [Synergistaceae bacterium]
MRRKNAFTFVELLIAMVIVAIVGGVAVTALWLILNTHSQMDDYTSADSEIEYAIQRLSRDFGLIGLGMPNNRKGKHSFAGSFRTTSGPASWPIMALLSSDADPHSLTNPDCHCWGGPVTVSAANPSSVYDAAHITWNGLWRTGAEFGPGGGAYVGPELYYFFAIPTGLKARFVHAADPNNTTATNETTMALERLIPPHTHPLFLSTQIPPTVTGGAYLRDFRYDERKVGLQAVNTAPRGRDMSTWLLFPTLRLPMMLKTWETNSLTVEVAPETELPMAGTIMGLDEVHLIQGARLYRNANNELVRVTFGADYNSSSGVLSDVLARNVVGLQFVYNPVSRLLTLHMAIRSNEANPAGYASPNQPTGWAPWLPPIAPSDMRYRVLAKSLTWRIRN